MQRFKSSARMDMQTTFKYRDFYIDRRLEPGCTGEPQWIYSLWGVQFTNESLAQQIYESANLQHIQKLKTEWINRTAEGWKDEQPSGDDQI